MTYTSIASRLRLDQNLAHATRTQQSADQCLPFRPGTLIPFWMRDAGESASFTAI